MLRSEIAEGRVDEPLLRSEIAEETVVGAAAAADNELPPSPTLLKEEEKNQGGIEKRRPVLGEDHTIL